MSQKCNSCRHFKASTTQEGCDRFPNRHSRLLPTDYAFVICTQEDGYQPRVEETLSAPAEEPDWRQSLRQSRDALLRRLNSLERETAELNKLGGLGGLP